MAFERTCQHLGAFNAEIDPAIFDGGQCCLGNARERSEPALAQFLKLTQDADGLADRNLDALFAGRNFFISGSPVIVRSDLDHLHRQGIGHDSVNHPPLQPQPR